MARRKKHPDAPTDTPTEVPAPVDPTPAAPAFAVTLRGRLQPKADGRRFLDPDPSRAFEAALTVEDYPADEPLIAWYGVRDLAALDVDYHGTEAGVEDADLARLGTSRPAFSWRTHGNGFRGVFAAIGDPEAGGLAADEVALLWTEALLRRGRLPWGWSGIEVKPQTRHPGYKRGEACCSHVQRSAGPDAGAIAWSILGGRKGQAEAVDPDRVEAYLDEHGLAIGERYDHERCPIEPSRDGGAKRRPVVVYENGIVCYACQAEGRGFVPWSRLVAGESLDDEGGSPNVLRVMAENWCHWEHARWILRDLVHLPERYHRRFYGALLKAVHATCEAEHDALIPRMLAKVFDGNLAFVRSAENEWVADDSFAPYGQGIQKVLTDLPALWRIGEKDGEAAILPQSRGMAGTFEASRDLTRWGYPPVRVLFGFDSGWRREGGGTFYMVVPQRHKPAKYTDPTEAEYRKARDWIEGHFPGIDLDYLAALVALKFCNQRGDAELPRVAVAGPSGAGKTSTVHLAAEITGEPNGARSIPMGNDFDRTKQHYGQEASAGGFALFDEWQKGAEGSKESLVKELLIWIKDGSPYHKLYVGLRRVQSAPVTVFTDTDILAALQADEQIRRRVAFVRLGGRDLGAKWEQTCGGGTLIGWRTRNDLNRQYSDAFCSFIARKYRDKTVDEILADLGIPMLGDEDKQERRLAAGAFFWEVCRMAGTHRNRRYHDRSRGGEGPFAIMRTICPASELEYRLESLAGADVSRKSVTDALTAFPWETLGPSLEIDVATEGVRSDEVAVRFRAGPLRGKGKSPVFNEACPLRGWVWAMEGAEPFRVVARTIDLRTLRPGDVREAMRALDGEPAARGHDWGDPADGDLADGGPADGVPF